MKISIITCTYNSEKYLQETINSVIEQSLDKDAFEHIFIDGYSNDKTIEIINTYKKNYDYDIKLFQCEKKGIYNAMNKGIKKSSGEYILFLHSDDFLEKQVLSEYIYFIKQTGYKDPYYAGCYKFNNTSKTKKLPINRLFYNFGLNKYLLGITTYITQPTVLEKKEVFEKYGYFDENFKIASDLLHYIEISGKISSKFFPKIVTNFRIHEESASTGNSANKVIQELENIFCKHFNIFFAKFFLFINKKYHGK